MVLNSEDKVGGSAVASSSNGGFRDVINNNGWIDMGFNEPKYTWSNRRQKRTNIQERLDRGFSNAEWKTLFPIASISHIATA